MPSGNPQWRPFPLSPEVSGWMSAFFKYRSVLTAGYEKRQIFKVNHGAFHSGKGSFQNIGQFTDIAGPFVSQQGFFRRGIQPDINPIHFVSRLFQQIPGNGKNIFLPFP
jgi:hypothetical protein